MRLFIRKFGSRWTAVMSIGLVLLLAACAAGANTVPGDEADSLPTDAASPVPSETQAPATEAPAETRPAATEGQDVLAGTAWELVSFGPQGSETAVLPDSNITLSFNPAGQAGGNGGCNSYGGGYRVDGDTIEFDELVSTLMACVDNTLTQQESLYLQTLQKATRFELSGDNLTLYYNGELVDAQPGDQASTPPAEQPTGQPGVLNFVRAAPETVPQATETPSA